jgi:hypothetical protein
MDAWMDRWMDGRDLLTKKKNRNVDSPNLQQGPLRLREFVSLPSLAHSHRASLAESIPPKGI